MSTDKRLERLKNTASNRQKDFIVVLEDVHDPHNASAVLRTCEAFGVQNIYFIFNKQKPYNPRKIGKSSSSSANKWLDFQIYNSVNNCIKDLRKMNYLIVASVCDNKAKSIFLSKLDNQKIALFLGNEHEGLSTDVIKLADILVTIPMRGMIQSLNISVSAGIFIYEISKQRKSAGKSFLINKRQTNKLLQDFRNR